MNILRIVYDWPEPWSGLAPAPYFMSKAQGKLGHQVMVLTGGLNKERIKKRQFVEHPEENVTVYHLPRALTQHTGPFLTTSVCALFMYWYLRFVKHKVDMVHGHGHTMLWLNIYKILFGWADKTPYTTHYHICSRFRVKKAKEKGEKMKFLQRFFENPLWDLADRTGVKVSDACIFVSETMKEEFVEVYHPPEEKLFVVESGLETEIFHPPQQYQTSFTHEIITVGKISPRKGPDVLIEAMKYLPPEYSMRWVGMPEDEEYLFEMKDLAKNLKVENRIIWEGYVPNYDLAPYYYNANIFVLPSQAEGLPKVVLEALGCGLQSLVSGFRVSVDISGLHYLSSLAPKVVAKEIQEVFKYPEPVDDKKVSELFSWDTKAKEVERVYAYVFNSRRK